LAVRELQAAGTTLLHEGAHPRVADRIHHRIRRRASFPFRYAPEIREAASSPVFQVCMPQRRTVRFSIVRKIRFSTSRPKSITVSRPANTSGISNWFLFSNTYQPRPPDPELTPKTSSAAIKVRHANAQPIFNPVRMLGNAPGIRMRQMYP